MTKSPFATRALLMEEQPSIDIGEITDKGYINQRAVVQYFFSTESVRRRTDLRWGVGTSCKRVYFF